mmetsp:Transcript_37450/g.27615  ORF Transcript_37450/g.27615 Transcript_37450/m.27615 type:complete len:96 (-) Transcript_37450:299-586(-)
MKTEKTFNNMLNRRNQKQQTQVKSSSNFSRSSSIEFENQEKKVAAIANFTKRKNSTRRQVNEPVEEQKQSANLGLKVPQKGGHKRNVLSVNPGGG